MKKRMWFRNLYFNRSEPEGDKGSGGQRFKGTVPDYSGEGFRGCRKVKTVRSCNFYDCAWRRMPLPAGNRYSVPVRKRYRADRGSDCRDSAEIA